MKTKEKEKELPAVPTREMVMHTLQVGQTVTLADGFSDFKKTVYVNKYDQEPNSIHFPKCGRFESFKEMVELLEEKIDELFPKIAFPFRKAADEIVLWKRNPDDIDYLREIGSFKIPVKSEGQTTGNLFKRWYDSDKKLWSIRGEVFSRIREICELCTNINSGDRITNIEIDEDGDYIGCPAIAVNVDNWEVGPDTYFFPKSYLDMTLDEVAADFEKRKKEEAEEKAREELEAERAVYIRLKEKFGGQDND